MERNMVLAVIFSAAAVVGAIETVYQVYQLTVIDAAARGLKHPKLWGLLAANGNNSSGLLLYLIGRRNYPVNSMDSRQVVVMEKRKKTAGIGLVFVAVGAIGVVFGKSWFIGSGGRAWRGQRKAAFGEFRGKWT